VSLADSSSVQVKIMLVCSTSVDKDLTFCCKYAGSIHKIYQEHKSHAMLGSFYLHFSPMDNDAMLYPSAVICLQ